MYDLLDISAYTRTRDKYYLHVSARTMRLIMTWIETRATFYSKTCRAASDFEVSEFIKWVKYLPQDEFTYLRRELEVSIGEVIWRYVTERKKCILLLQLYLYL